ncbi:lytic transglycosylase domain-containing protein [Rurimicrobium arvi]|uniref:Transglycosylase SLT domain-containing protein n=1 Tax=Rurimicrobium arvi TaxID=2049916 RepID=A0ABP8MZ75_9BACT
MMQLKVFFIAGLLGCFSLSSSGQYWKERMAAGRGTDPVKEKKREQLRIDSAKAREQFCKEEEARSVIAIALAESRDQRQKAMVPLAGQKSYFKGMNDYVIEFVRKYLASHNKTLLTVDTRSKSKFPMIDNVLTKNNLPHQLKYLAVIESALNNRAVSPVGAVGPWQFMEETGRLMGLTVNGKRDDRTDWFKSTNAAAKYLNYLYAEMQDWLLVIASYNCGPTPVKRAIEKTGSHNFWEIKQYLPLETQGHVLAFIATASIFENMKHFIPSGNIPDDFVMHPEMATLKNEIKKPKPKVAFTEAELKNMSILHLKRPLSFEIIEQELQVDKHLLERWNPDYDLFVMNIYPDSEYKFRFPKDKMDEYTEKRAAIAAKSEKYFQELLL